MDFYKILKFLQESIELSLKMTGATALIRVAFHDNDFESLWKWALCFFVLGLIICVVSDAYGRGGKSAITSNR